MLELDSAPSRAEEATMKRSALCIAVGAALLGATGFAGWVQAAPRLCDDGSRPPCRDTGEAAANNLSYPVIWSDGVSILAPLSESEWTFATVTDPASQCFTGDTGGLPVPEDAVCYYDGTVPALSHVWWLQQVAGIQPAGHANRRDNRCGLGRRSRVPR
jgi:hypothetical protein